MFSRAFNSTVFRTSALRTAQSTSRVVVRQMGGGGDKDMFHDEKSKLLGEAMSILMWLWIIHRFRKDGDVLLGFRYSWQHAGGHDHDHHEEATGGHQHHH